MQLASLKLPKTWVNLFFFYAAALTLINGLIVIRVSRNWTLSNWLVNYEGGFIRRGLPGQVAYILSRVTHLSPVVYVVFFYLLCYLIIFWSARFFVLASSLNLWVLALLLSPATFSYQFLHPRSGYNKEIIHIAALALFLLLLKKGKLSSTGVVLYLTAAILIGTLSHEGNIFYAPYFFAALMFSGRSFKEAVKACALPALVGVVATYFCSKHIGNEQIVNQICSSIGYKFEVPNSTEICANGAMVYLVRSREFARAETVMFIHKYGYWSVFPFFAALALVPAVGETLVLARARFSRELTVLWTSVFVSFLGTLVLFYFAVDWGRWIYIHVISIAFLLLYLDVQRVERDGPDAPASQILMGRRIIGWAFLFAYAAFWILPTGAEPIRMGYVGRLKYVTHYSDKAASEQRGQPD
jgi:hypothetical protein